MMNIKKGDTVTIIAGRDKGKTGKVLAVSSAKNKVIVEGRNMVVKTKKRQNEQDKGGIMNIEAPIAISNVALMGKGGKATRVGFTEKDGKKVRVAKKTGEVL